jgi:hypothetical protein
LINFSRWCIRYTCQMRFVLVMNERVRFLERERELDMNS